MDTREIIDAYIKFVKAEGSDSLPLFLRKNKFNPCLMGFFVKYAKFSASNANVIGSSLIDFVGFVLGKKLIK